GEVIDLDVLFAEANGDVIPNGVAQTPGFRVLARQWVWIALLGGLGGLVAQFASELGRPLRASILTKVGDGPWREMTAADGLALATDRLQHTWPYALLVGCVSGLVGLAWYGHYQRHPLYKPNWVTAIVFALFAAAVITYPIFWMLWILVPLWVGLWLPFWMERWPKKWHRVLDIVFVLAVASLPYKFWW
ncbi:MAG: hypothetical protein K8H99_13105, partial [Nitrospirae bacterium]|nr:hypothetical protein [Fimbriimonadaceae bacterium]